MTDWRSSFHSLPQVPRAFRLWLIGVPTVALPLNSIVCSPPKWRFRQSCTHMPRYLWHLSEAVNMQLACDTGYDTQEALNAHVSGRRWWGLYSHSYPTVPREPGERVNMNRQKQETNMERGRTMSGVQPSSLGRPSYALLESQKASLFYHESI